MALEELLHGANRIVNRPASARGCRIALKSGNTRLVEPIAKSLAPRRWHQIRRNEGLNELVQGGQL